MFSTHSTQTFSLLYISFSYLYYLVLAVFWYACSLASLILPHFLLLHLFNYRLLSPSLLNTLLYFSPMLFHLSVIFSLRLTQFFPNIHQTFFPQSTFFSGFLLRLLLLSLSRQSQFCFSLSNHFCLFTFALKEGKFLLVRKCPPFLFLVLDLQYRKPSSQHFLWIVDLLQFTQSRRTIHILLGNIRNFLGAT